MAGMTIPIAPAKSAAALPASTWGVWTSAPHRVLFLPGAVQLVAAIALMAVEIGGRSLALWPVPAWTLPPAWAHGYLLVFGLFPWFIFGFAMTAVPNWTGGRIARRAWLATGLPMIAGVALFHAGLFLSPTLAVAGGFLQVAGWLAGTAALARIALPGPSRDVQAVSIVALLAGGAVLAALYLVALARTDADTVERVAAAGVWLFLLPVFLVVSHRLVPFFSSRVLQGYALYRPAFSLPFLAAACLLHFVLEASGAPQWTWLADAPMAAWVGWLAWRWGLARSFRARLLAMLHVALAVLSAALAFHAIASLAALAGHPGLFGRGPMHLLAVGYFAAMTLGMVSRVSLGHSGRALEADGLTWYGFLAVIGVGGVRALADLAPLAGAPRAWLLAAAAAAWIAVTGAWAARFVPIYLAPRPDGRPG